MAKKTYTSAEAAARIGISRQTLYSWIEEGMVQAPKPIQLGRASIRLWAVADIDRVRKFKGTLKPGRPKRRGKSDGDHT
jgi:excisionase family DNA binding protein